MALASVKRHSREYKTLLALDADMKELQRLFNEGLVAKESDTESLIADKDIKYSFGQYTDHQKENWSNSKRIIIYENDVQFEKFIDKAITDRKYDQKMYFGVFNRKLAKMILDATGIDVSGYNCSLKANEIRKIFGSHGDEVSEQLRGQRAVTKEDILNIPKIIQSPDNIIRSPKDYKGSPTIVFSKNINGKNTVIAYTAYGPHDLTIQTMYVGNKNRSLAVEPSGKTPFSQTSETNNGTASNNNISNPAENVKGNSENEKKFSVRETMRNSNGDELTPEQAEFFKNSKAVDEDGDLRVVYHGTTNKFTVFDRDYSDVESDWGKGYYFTSEYEDMRENYASTEGPDLINKIERYAERLEYEEEYADYDYEERKKIAQKRFITSEPNTITAYLNIENPVYVGENETYLDFEEAYNEEEDYYEDATGLLVDFIEALNERQHNFDIYKKIDFWSIVGDSFYDGGIKISDITEILNNNLLNEVLDENGDIAVKELIRSALEDIGFDGIIDTTVSTKFKTMNSLYGDTTHYVVFNSNQIKSTDNLAPTGNEDIRYSYREDTTDNTADPNDSINDNAFNSQLEQWLKGEHKGEYFELGNTPEILKKHGAKNLPIIMSEQVLVKITGEKHAISIDNIATLPQQIRKPILLFKGSIDNSFVVVTEMKDKSGNEVVCAIHLNKYQQRFRVNRIASLYGKKNIVDYVLSNIDNGNLLDADIRKAPVWFTNRGLQLPKLVQTITDAKQTVSQNSDAVKGIIRNNSQGDTHKFSENEKSSYREFKGTPEQASREQLEKTLAVLEKQLKLTAGSELDRKAVRRYAKKLKQSYSAAMDIDKLTDKILRSTRLKTVKPNFRRKAVC